MNCFVLFSVEGFHNWPTAPDRLTYLRDLHRHEFVVHVKFPQKENRGIEFHEFAERCECHFKSLGHPGPYVTVAGRDYGAKSCETLALELSNLVRDDFDLDWVQASVAEDGRFGAIMFVERPEPTVHHLVADNLEVPLGWKMVSDETITAEGGD